MADAGTADRAFIEEMLLVRDSHAYVDADWLAVEADFDEARFVGYRWSGEGEAWRVGFSTLQAYRDEWLRQAEASAASPMPGTERASQLLSACRIGAIDIDGSHAVVHKLFDGAIGSPGHEERLLWQTQYFLHNTDRWRIVGFVGYLPYAGSTA